MVTKRIDLQDTPTSLEELLTLLDEDTEILLTRGDTPLARLSPVDQPPADEQRTTRKSLYGMWSDVDVSEDDIEAARDDMWGNFPREDV